MNVACPICLRQFASKEAVTQHGRAKHGRLVVAIEPDPIAPPACIECGASAELVGGKRIYPHRPDLYEKQFWLCGCGAYCGCHGLTDQPLGNPAGPETRRARSAAHANFDPIWRRREMHRSSAYAWLSRELDIPPEQTHIGMMTAEQAWRVVDLCNQRRRSFAA